MSQFFTPFVIVSLMPLWVAIAAGIFVLTFGRRIARQDRADRLAREAIKAEQETRLHEAHTSAR
jgi:hypothetical protein